MSLQQNILINDKGEPLLADFGLSKVCLSSVLETIDLSLMSIGPDHGGPHGYALHAKPRRLGLIQVVRPGAVLRPWYSIYGF